MACDFRSLRKQREEFRDYREWGGGSHGLDAAEKTRERHLDEKLQFEAEKLQAAQTKAVESVGELGRSVESYKDDGSLTGDERMVVFSEGSESLTEIEMTRLGQSRIRLDQRFNLTYNRQSIS